MAIAPIFEYARPASLAEALRLKDQYRERALVLAGGTDLVAQLREGQIHPDLLIDVKDIPELDDLCFNEERIHIGAAICFHYIINSDAMLFDFQMLKDACQTVASTGIRNRATLVGNICTAVPSLDSAPPLLCHEAIIHCASIAGNRDIPIAKWFLAPRKTALQSNEIVTGVTVPSALGFAGIYLKLGRYGGEDLAQAGWGIMLNYAHHYRIAHCALAPIPARAHSIEALLNGKELTEDLVRQAMELVPHEISPITDIRSSAEYRLQISKVMLQRGLWAALDRLHGKEVEAAKLLGGIA